jgi:hypothetical protein
MLFKGKKRSVGGEGASWAYVPAEFWKKSKLKK